MHTNSTFESNRQNRFSLTRHAKRRCSQRGIRDESVVLVRAFGERSHDGRGGIRCLMTRAAVQRLESVVGHSQRTESLTGVYVVLSADDEQVVITAAHRF